MVAIYILTRRVLSALLSITLSVACFGQAAAQGKPTAVVATDQVRAELMVHAPDGVAPGKNLWIGLQLAHIPHWHTYWKNPGDSGLATTLEWSLPPGITAGDIAWPLPKKFPIGNLANYGYEGTILLPVPITVSPDFKAPLLSGEVEVRLKATWLVCKTECIPQEGDFSLKLPVRSSSALNTAAFEAAWQAEPKRLVGSAANTALIDKQAIQVSVAGLPAAWQGKNLELFAETPEVFETAARWSQQWNGALWSARLPLSAQRSASPAVLPLVLALEGNATRVETTVQGAWPAPTAALVGTPPPVAQGTGFGRTATPALTFWAALAGALLGGLILNLMPCVFPVLAIKVIGFARHATNRRVQRVSGIAYTGGVVLSFLGLAVLMLALRSAGENLGWGFQLQDPVVVAMLAALFTLLGLNLAGVFDFGSVLPSSVASFQAKNPAADAFGSGVLAVAVAAPCTAPFMGASLGLAMALPAAEALAIFAALGLGMAAPFLLASQVPAFASLLPKPGAWMDTFRKLMAFPMFATVVWLVWVLGHTSGIDGAGALLALLVALALVAWAATLVGPARTWVGLFAIGALALLLWGLGPTLTRSTDPSLQNSANGWEPWEPGRVEQVVASGRPVFVDFTAAWCITCQYNKQTVLGDSVLLAEFAQRKVVLLRADWTRRDPAITAALHQLGRNGVPVYVLYQAGRPPVVLSEILSVPEVRAVLARL